MGNSVLAGCGRYSDKLTKISELIIEQKIKDGKIPSKNDIWEIDSQIFEAYQIILGTAKDPNVIAKSIELLKDSVQDSGSISDLNNLAISSVQKSLKEQSNNIVENEDSSKVLETAAAMVIITDIMKDGSLNNLDNFLNTEIVNNLDIEIEKARNGDDEALGGIIAFKGAAETLGKYEQLDEKQTREVLARMMRLAAYDSPANRKLLEEMSNKYGFDILKKGENGELSISEDKLTEIYQSKLPSNSKTSVRTVNDFKEINKRKAKEARESGNIPKNGTELSGKVKINSKEKKISKVLNEVLKEENEEAIAELAEKYPEEVKKLLKIRIDAINKAQELGKKISPKIQGDVLKINSAIKTVKEQGKEQGKEIKKVDGAR